MLILAGQSPALLSPSPTAPNPPPPASGLQGPCGYNRPVAPRHPWSAERLPRRPCTRLSCGHLCDMKLGEGSRASRPRPSPGLLLLGLLLLPAVVARIIGENRSKAARGRGGGRGTEGRAAGSPGAGAEANRPRSSLHFPEHLLSVRGCAQYWGARPYWARCGLWTRKWRPNAARKIPKGRLVILGVTTRSPTLMSPCPPPPADPEEENGDLQCMCLKTTSGIHPKHIRSLEVIGAGPHCPTSQVMWVLTPVLASSARLLPPLPSPISSHRTQSLMPRSNPPLKGAPLLFLAEPPWRMGGKFAWTRRPP